MQLKNKKAAYTEGNIIINKSYYIKQQKNF